MQFRLLVSIFIFYTCKVVRVLEYFPCCVTFTRLYTWFERGARIIDLRQKLFLHWNLTWPLSNGCVVVRAPGKTITDNCL